MLNGYWRPTPKFCLKLSLALRAAIGTIAGAAYIQDKPVAAFWILTAGAVLDFLIQCQQGDDDGTGGCGSASCTHAAALLLLIPAVLLFATGCRTVKTASTYKLTDSSWVTKRKVGVHVTGATTPAANLDSLRRTILGVAAREGCSLQIVHDEAGSGRDTVTVRDTIKVVDKSGRAELRMWTDANGKMYADCSAKDTTIQALVNENNRLIRESSTKVKTIYKWPSWLIWACAIGAFLLVLLILKSFAGGTAIGRAFQIKKRATATVQDIDKWLAEHFHKQINQTKPGG
jgi:hypothetical protein